MERIRASSRHLLGLVNDVLDLAKIEAGETMVQAEPVEVGSVLSESLQMVVPEAEARGLTLLEQWDCAESTRFVGDEDRVRQIMLNLLSNALKFTPAGGTVTVRCAMLPGAAPEAALPETGPWVVFEVRDTGSGIPGDQLQRVFEAFVQMEAGHTRRVGGTGLGLTISRRLARLMSGDITVRSQPGQGSCFYLWLPAMVQDRVTTGTVVADGGEWPTPSGVSAYRAVGQLVLVSAELLEEELVWKLRAAQGAQTADDADRARLADHTAAFLAGLGRSVAALDNQEENRELLNDGAALRREVAQRHGAQRRRLGWQRSDIEREYRILRDTLESYLLREAPRRTDVDITAALDAVHRFLDEARRVSLEAFDTA